MQKIKERLTQMKTLEVEVVRVKITLACTECKQRNYNMTKEKKNHPEPVSYTHLTLPTN